jgi:RHS repeat-associated protein
MKDMKNIKIEYGYFDNGNRAWKRVTEAGQEPVVTCYVHDGIHVIAEYNGEGTLLKEYVYSDNIDEVLNIKDGTENLFPHQDGLNSVVAVTDADGERVASYNYEAFGTIKDATGALDNNITYTGRWLEPETGDYFYRARYYDPISGRFISEDPIGFYSGEYNFYRYVTNNPVNHIDPFGLKKGFYVVATTIKEWYGGVAAFLGVAHVDITYNGTVIYVGQGGLDSRLDNPPDGMVHKHFPLTIKKSDKLKHGEYKDCPCKNVKDEHVLDCIHSKPKNPRKNCQGDVHEAVVDCCLSGYSSVVGNWFSEE